jgi:hypothetical protein
MASVSINYYNSNWRDYVYGHNWRERFENWTNNQIDLPEFVDLETIMAPSVQPEPDQTS